MKLIIFGGAGTGKTILASLFAKKTNFEHIDSDDYYWKKTELPFQEKVSLNDRNKNMKKKFTIMKML